MHCFALLLAVVAGLGTVSSTIFLGLALIGARRFHVIAKAQKSFESSLDPHELPFVSILKPLHGGEAQLEQNLESFFVQDYPDFEVLFAAETADDPATEVARRVAARHPERTCTMVVYGEPPWPNPPAYAFFRMAEQARAEILVTSDSDVIVDRNYLRQVVPPLLQTNTGMVTCIYRGLSAGGFWSRMDAMGMSVEMTAGVVIANWLIGKMDFGLGPTIVVRRDALQAIGGYEAVGEYFSNDFMIGHLIAAKGFDVALSRHIISHIVPPMTFARMWQRQLRWAAGTRRSRPWGHLGTGLVFAVPCGLLAGIAGSLLGHPVAGAAVFVWAVLNRTIESLVIGWGVVRDPECRRRPWLYAVRDFLGFIVWAASYLRGKIIWRKGRFELGKDGRVLVRDRGGNLYAFRHMGN